MKILAAILALAGVGNVLSAFEALSRGSLFEASLALLGAGLALSVALGIVRKKSVAWPLGFVLIGASALHFVLSVSPLVPHRSEAGRVAMISFCVIGALLVSAFWSIVWHRQRAYFFPEGPKGLTSR